jgi:hypothetical protein
MLSNAALVVLSLAAVDDAAAVDMAGEAHSAMTLGQLPNRHVAADHSIE